LPQWEALIARQDALEALDLGLCVTQGGEQAPFEVAHLVEILLLFRFVAEDRREFQITLQFAAQTCLVGLGLTQEGRDLCVEDQVPQVEPALARDAGGVVAA